MPGAVIAASIRALRRISAPPSREQLARRARAPSRAPSPRRAAAARRARRACRPDARSARAASAGRRRASRARQRRDAAYRRRRCRNARSASIAWRRRPVLEARELLGDRARRALERQRALPDRRHELARIARHARAAARGRAGAGRRRPARARRPRRARACRAACRRCRAGRRPSASRMQRAQQRRAAQAAACRRARRGGSAASPPAPRVISTSRGSSRSGTAAITRPGASSPGTSFSECTAQSMLPSSSASSISLTNRPLPPTWCSGTSTNAVAGGLDHDQLGAQPGMRRLQTRAAPTPPAPARAGCRACRCAGRRSRLVRVLDDRTGGAPRRGRTPRLRRSLLLQARDRRVQDLVDDRLGHRRRAPRARAAPRSFSCVSVFSSSARRIASTLSRSATIVGTTSRWPSQRQNDSTSSSTIASAFSASRARSSRFSSATFAEVVDVVEVDVVELVDARIEVARHAQVDAEHRPPFALAQHLVHHAPRVSTYVVAGGRADDDVGHLQVLAGTARTAPAWRRSRAPARRRGRRCGWSTIMLPTPLRQQMPRRELAHLAGADQHRGLVLEAIEDRRRQLDRRRAHRHGAAGDAGLGAHALGDRERLVEPAVQHRAGRCRRWRRGRRTPSAGRGSAARRRPSSRGSRRRGTDAARPRGRE